MKNVLFFLSIILLSSCGSANELKKQNTDLLNQASTMQSKIELLTADKAALSSSITSLEMKEKEYSASLNACNSELDKVKDFYGAYKNKLTQMKSELLASFPNNLNEENFSIREEDGRLIITIPNKILYPRGSAEFNPEALIVIQKLTKVFRNNQNLQILVEGHTDETPLRQGSQYKDNWDLSVARAVKIVRQFETYGVHPQRLTAAGRGYFAPVNKLATEEARAMNRRTEIIIRPKIAELLRMMDGLE